MSTESTSTEERREEIRSRHREAAEEAVPDELGLYIGGEFVEAESGERFPVTDPTTGETLVEVPAGGSEDVDRAVTAAREAYESEWSDYDPADRQEALNAVADTIEDNFGEFAKLETLDNGKPIREAKGDVASVADHFRYFAGATRVNEGTTMPADDTRNVQTLHEPYGVVGAITPWNFPLLIATWKLAPALAAGNTVVLKPAEEAPLSVLKLASLLDDELPEGALNVVTGFGEEAGEPLTRHEGVDKLSFTGSTEVGKQVMKNAADNVTDVTLELGGKNPFVVHPDADIDSTVRNAFISIFYNTGECCSAGSRMFVHEDVYDELMDEIVGMAQHTSPDDPLIEDTSFGAKISDEQLERMASLVEIAREDGGNFLAGGAKPDDEALAEGSFYQPTIIEGLDHDSESVQNEVFGPVLQVFEWSDYDEMIEMANDVDYGLAAGVMAGDVKTAIETAKDLEVGTVWINQYNDFPAGQPFGGYKESGIGRETAFETIQEFSRTKSINLSLR